MGRAWAARNPATAIQTPTTAVTCGYYRTSSPVTARPMIIRWISEVPSKMVKIVDYGAVSAGQWPARGRGVSTDSAPAVRGWQRFPAAPRTLSSAVRTRAKKAPFGRSRNPTPPQVHLRYIRALTCQYSSCRRDVPRRQHDPGSAARTGHTPAGCVGTRFHPGPAVVGPTRRHHGADRPWRAPPAYTAVMMLPVRAASGGCQSHSGTRSGGA
jgi:hypothetical protein